MNTKHTKGEWFVNYHNNEMKVRARNIMMGTICTINDIIETEAEANAKLIASAPQLLEALIEAQKLVSIARQYMPKQVTNSHKFEFENISANCINKAIKTATE